MGHGTYTHAAYQKLFRQKGYAKKQRSEIFASNKIDPAMDPRKIQIRESRDSDEHPLSTPIVLGLDVTGSMGFVPEELVREQLPKLMNALLQAGVPDPQVLFLGIGDFAYDSAPLQVGQFESSAELLDRWLTRVWLEGGGGGGNNESYNLAHYFAGHHTITDSFEKRNQKGFLITIGDEPCATSLPGDIIKRLTPRKKAKTLSTAELIKKAREQYSVHHIHLEHDNASAGDHRKQGWRELLQQDFIVLDDHQKVASTIARIVTDGLATNIVPSKTSKAVEMIL